MTPRQKEAYDFISNYSRKQGVSPTVRELSDGLNIKSSSQAQSLIDGLVRRGLVRKTPKVWRGIFLTGNCSGAK